MPHGKLYATSIDKGQVVALEIVYDCVGAWTPKKDSGTGCVAGTSNDELWLK
jgi:hypothetical protein